MRVLWIVPLLVLAGCTESSGVDPEMEALAADALEATQAAAGPDGTLRGHSATMTMDMTMETEEGRMDMIGSYAMETTIFQGGSYESHSEVELTTEMEGDAIDITMQFTVTCTPEQVTLRMSFGEGATDLRSAANDGACDLNDADQMMALFDEDELDLWDQSGGMQFGWLMDTPYRVTKARGTAEDAWITYELDLGLGAAFGMEIDLEMVSHIVDGLIVSDTVEGSMDIDEEMFGQTISMQMTLTGSSSYTYGPRDPVAQAAP